MLLPHELLEIRSTLQRAQTLRNILVRVEGRYPVMADIAYRIEPVLHVADQIGQVLNDRGEVMDSASPKLARLRSGDQSSAEPADGPVECVINSPTRRSISRSRLSRSGRALRRPPQSGVQGPYPRSDPRPVFQRRDAVHRAVRCGGVEQTTGANCRWTRKRKRRLLAELSDLVADEAPPTSARRWRRWPCLDLIFAARYADDLRATEPELVEWKKVGKEGPGRKRERRKSGKLKWRAMDRDY